MHGTDHHLNPSPLSRYVRPSRIEFTPYLPKTISITVSLDLFGKAGKAFLNEVQLPSIFRMEIDGYLKLLENLKQLIHNPQAEITNRCLDK